MANDQTNVELSDLIRTIVRETVAELVSTGTITTTKTPLAETAQLLTPRRQLSDYLFRKGTSIRLRVQANFVYHIGKASG